jgi:hypothetical protein
MHEVVVPAGGLYDAAAGTWTTCAFIGLPLTASRSGGEVSLEMADKSVLADHGVRPRTFKKGMYVHIALREIIRMTGERHYRIQVPRKKKKLSRSYTVGMGENQLTPWQAFKLVASRELGYRAFYSSDGFATAESTKTAKTPVKVKYILALPEQSASFTDFINYVKVTSFRKPKNKAKGKTKGKTQKKTNVVAIKYETVAVLPASHQLSEQSLNRNGALQTRPLVVSDNNLKDGKAVRDKAIAELKKGSDVENEQTLECFPFLHLDYADSLDFPMGLGKVAYDECSVPFGTGGNMTVGATKWVSKAVKVKRARSKRTVIRRKKKGGKKNA